MKADKTREILEISYVYEEGIAICESKYYQCKAELDELERLAEIGKATEEAYKCSFKMTKGQEMTDGFRYEYICDEEFETIEELLTWAESEE